MILLKGWCSKVVIIALIAVVGCNTQTDDKSKLIAKKWAYKEFKMNEEIMTGDQLNNPVMEFFDNGKYKVEFGEMSEEGAWKVEGDELVTTTSDNKINRLKIMELTEEKMLLYSDLDGVKAYITLEPLSAEDN